MHELEKYYVYDLLSEKETVTNVNEEDVRNYFPNGYFDLTESIYDRKRIRITPKELKIHKDIESAKKEHWLSESSEYRCLMEFGTQVMPFANKIKGQRVLDIGCGYGDLAFGMEKLGAESIVAADVYKQNIDICNKVKSRYGSNIVFKVKDINDLTVDYLSQFDTITAFQCLSWTHCHLEFIKNTNKAGVKNLILSENIFGLPILDGVNSKVYNDREPSASFYYSEGYHYGGHNPKNVNKCLRLETNLAFWTHILYYNNWYIKDWTWQKNCTFNNKPASLHTYRKRFVFHCINTTGY